MKFERTPVFDDGTEICCAKAAPSKASPQSTERGQEFAVSMMFSSSEPVHGWMEIGFDLAALTLLSAGMEYETLQGGRLRLRLERAQSVFSAEMRFLANAAAPGQTSIELVQAYLSTVNDRGVLPTVADGTTIAISSLSR